MSQFDRSGGAPTQVAGVLGRWRKRVRALKFEVVALAIALRDPRTPVAARLLIMLVLAYALSPIDLIPDFIPVLGLLDDLVLVPLGIAFALRLVPAPVMVEARERAATQRERSRRHVWLGAALVLAIWLALLVWAVLAFFPGLIGVNR